MHICVCASYVRRGANKDLYFIWACHFPASRRITILHYYYHYWVDVFQLLLDMVRCVGGSRTTDAFMLQTRLCVALMHDRVVLSPHVAIVMSMLGWLGVSMMVIQAKRPSRNGISDYGIVPIPLVGHMNKKAMSVSTTEKSLGSASFRSCNLDTHTLFISQPCCFLCTNAEESPFYSCMERGKC